jgi:predicted nucleotidyltransferase
LLMSQFRCTRVYLFGSLVAEGGEWFGAHSDIDLAVEALPAERYWAALVAVEEQLPHDTRFDLVRLEDARPSLSARIRTNGVLLADGAATGGVSRRSGE